MFYCLDKWDIWWMVKLILLGTVFTDTELGTLKTLCDYTNRVMSFSQHEQQWHHMFKYGMIIRCLKLHWNKSLTHFYFLIRFRWTNYRSVNWWRCLLYFILWVYRLDRRLRLVFWSCWNGSFFSGKTWKCRNKDKHWPDNTVHPDSRMHTQKWPAALCLGCSPTNKKEAVCLSWDL